MPIVAPSAAGASVGSTIISASCVCVSSHTGSRARCTGSGLRFFACCGIAMRSGTSSSSSLASSSSSSSSSSPCCAPAWLSLRFLRRSRRMTSLKSAKRRICSACSASLISTLADRRDLACAVERRMSVSRVRAVKGDV